MTIDFTKPGYYRTRDGRKAEVLKYYPVDGGVRPIKGGIYKEGMWDAFSWGVNGTYFGSTLTMYDLIAPWEEKKTYDLSKMWVGWFDKGDGDILRGNLVYASKKNLLEHIDSVNLIAITPATATTFVEGEGLE